MITAIARLDLSLRRKSLILYSLGMAAYVLVVVALYPAFENSTSLDQFAQDSPNVAALFGIAGSLTSPVGWMNANIFANFFPLIILLLTIGYGAWAVAGQERDGILELVMALPVRRRRVVAEKMLALVVQALVFSAVVYLCSLAGRGFDVDIDAWELATATFGVMLLGVDFGFLALAIGATTGERGWAIGIGSAVAAAAYLVSSMAPVVDWLEPARYASLFYWSVGNGQLAHGLGVADLAVLGGTAVALAMAVPALFARHDMS